MGLLAVCNSDGGLELFVLLLRVRDCLGLDGGVYLVGSLSRSLLRIGLLGLGLLHVHLWLLWVGLLGLLVRDVGGLLEVRLLCLLLGIGLGRKGLLRDSVGVGLRL
jgi:hypothetical protein